MTSNEEPEGIEAFLTIYTSLLPSSLSKKTEAVIPDVCLFAKVIPITIDSNAVPVSYTHLRAHET